MNTKLMKTLLDDYHKKYDDIIAEYGERDGFIIKGTIWWEYYKELINSELQKIKKGTFNLNDAADFYKVFGFGPKLYNRTFVENGIENIKKLFLFLADDNISANKKISEIVEDTESENFFRGVGINFVTLFLTSYFPQKYVQWNAQTDGALKILKCFPTKERGEKKSDFYLKINDVCKSIMKTLKLESLTHVDNYIYCINKGYIGSKELIEKEIVDIIDQEPIEKPKKADISRHLEMMYYLVKIGTNKGYDVWVATNDRKKIYNNEPLTDLCLPEMPLFTHPQTLSIAKYIDVIWFKKRSVNPVRFFEIENSTSIYSGLLRFNDIKIDYPMPKATIVIPSKKTDSFEKQIDRRTFKHSELSDICGFVNYEDLKKWYIAASVDSKYS